MKFLCVDCDQQMTLVETLKDPRGFLSILYGCPECNHRISMLTNPGETQVVTSLGVKIEPSSQQEALSQCPFGDLVREMEQDVSSQMDWTSAAAARLANIPDFVRPMAKQGIESYARERGYALIDEQVMDEAKGEFGM